MYRGLKNEEISNERAIVEEEWLVDGEFRLLRVKKWKATVIRAI